MVTAGNETASGPAGTLGSFLQTANLNILGAADNRGVLGVEGGNGLATQDPATQTTGIEFGIPLSLLDLGPGDPVSVFVALTNSDGYLSNQFLPTDTQSTVLSNLGNESVTPRPYSFSSMPGNQFVSYTISTGCSCIGDVAPAGSPNGIVDINDLSLLLSNYGRLPDDPCMDFNQSGGPIEINDLSLLLSRFGTACN
jgi:hypothetical protein